MFFSIMVNMYKTLLLTFILIPLLSYSQELSSTTNAVDTATTTSSSSEQVELEAVSNVDSIITRPQITLGDFEVSTEEGSESDLAITRDLTNISIFNIFAQFVASAISLGVPAETIVLTLLIPLLASIVVFSRTIVGLPSLDMLVVISFSIALLAAGLLTGLILLSVIILSSMLARIIFKRIKIMQLPKVGLSILFVSFSVLIALVVMAMINIVNISTISIVPVLLLIILSERIVRIQFESSPREAWFIAAVTLLLGLIGYLILSSQAIREFVLNYPEIILLLIPANIAMGRFFGLRLTEYARFSAFDKR